MNVQEIVKLTRAGYCYYYVQASEVVKASEDIIKIFDEYKNGGRFNMEVWDFETDPDPSKVIGLLKDTPTRTVILAKNFNWFLKDEFQGFNKEFVQHLQNSVDIYSSTDLRKVLIIVSDSDFASAIPECLQKDFMNLEYSLPNMEEIKAIYDFICASVKGSKEFVKPSAEEEVKILDSARGLTRREVQNAFAYSLIKDSGKMKSETIAKLQAKEVEKTAGLKIGKYNVPELLGYDNLKKFVLGTITSKLAKGIMLLGPAGTGKTHFCKWVASAVNMKIIEMEMAELFGSLVGESEKLMKKAIDIITANAPCILFIDEIEKGLAGVGANQVGDGGTTKRSMAQFLKFLSDSRPDGVYVIATCNNISSLPPEWVRAERWDAAPFFVDLPNNKEANAILDYYKKTYGVKGNPKKMDGWSGAEIKSVCRIASMMGTDVGKAEDFIIPVSSTMKSEIDSLRKWSIGKTIPSTIAVTIGKGRSVEI